MEAEAMAKAFADILAYQELVKAAKAEILAEDRRDTEELASATDEDRVLVAEEVRAVPKNKKNKRTRIAAKDGILVEGKVKAFPKNKRKRTKITAEDSTTVAEEVETFPKTKKNKRVAVPGSSRPQRKKPALAADIPDVELLQILKDRFATGQNRDILDQSIQFLTEIKKQSEDLVDVIDLVTPERAVEPKPEEKINLECQCCFEEVPLDETIECGKELHTFCKNCIIKECGVAIGVGNAYVKCFAVEDCTEFFPNASLEQVLPPQMFQKMQTLQQSAEVAKAAIEGLENCPFCEFAYVPSDGVVFQCMKEGCQKASCRLCKEDAHHPLKCDEVVKEQDVRQKIENAMTEQLIRKCYKCEKKFVKLDGCNKMTCPCGAKMCYLCRKPVTDYTHFNGQGGEEHWKCPLWSETDVLHVLEVQNAGIKARDEEMAKAPELALTYDPTKDMA